VVAATVARLLVSCPDTRGIVAAVSEFLFSRGANIVTSDRHSTDIADGRFFLRMEFASRPTAASWNRPSSRMSERGIERVVLARVVAAHLDDRVLVFENRTVVF
jgi:formyltetrahydrofolate hydrolase